MHRSAAEQIESWADLARELVKSIDPESLLAVRAGLEELRVEHSESSPFDPDAVFAALDNACRSGARSQAISSGSVLFEASATKPGCLKACHPDCRAEAGRFVDGRFHGTRQSAGL